MSFGRKDSSPKTGDAALLPSTALVRAAVQLRVTRDRLAATNSPLQADVETLRQLALVLLATLKGRGL